MSAVVRKAGDGSRVRGPSSGEPYPGLLTPPVGGAESRASSGGAWAPVGRSVARVPGFRGRLLASGRGRAGRPGPVGWAPWALLALLLGPGCASDRPRPIRPADDLVDPNPTRRLEAVSEVGRGRNGEYVATLIEMLDDDDPAVRLAAGSALAGLTGRDTGYVAYAGPQERRRQVVEWRSWFASSQGRARIAAMAPPAGVGRPDREGP